MFVTRPTSAYTGHNRGAVYNQFFLVYNAFKCQPGWPPNSIPYSQCGHCRISLNACPYESLAALTPSKTFRPITLYSRHSSQNSTTTSQNGWKLGSGVLVEDKRMYTNWNRENMTTTDGIERVRKWRSRGSAHSWVWTPTPQGFVVSVLSRIVPVMTYRGFQGIKGCW